MPMRPIEILLVEDNPGDVRLAQEALKENNLKNTLHIVVDGEAALRFLRKEGSYAGAPTPDLVFLDLSLPKLDGVEVLAEMAKDYALRDIAVVVLAASPLDRQLLKGHTIATECFVIKPLTFESYLNAVRCFPHLGLTIVSTAFAGGEKR